MALTRRRGFFESSRILYIPIQAISPNPNQPRTRFSREGLLELAVSIEEHGILQPLSVRRCDHGYELISGERRLRAAKLAHLTEVPCLLVTASDVESSLLALMENLQRRDLDFVEEANALSRLIRTYHLSQEEAARQLGKSQSSVANKLRILRLPPDVLTTLRTQSLTERHARALLRLPTPQLQRQVVEQILRDRLTVSDTEALIEGILSPPPEEAPEEEQKAPAPRAHRPYIIKDVRLFLNSINHGMDVMRNAGLDVTCGREETEQAILLTISIPKSASK